ncbi:hypothetical protein [Nocardia arthritidis]|uniref:Hsp70 family protein n=1 Tax=Nocardia arthritidis TaxID=228602 RepID=A0A6G9YBW6_9NOCA|nr:hypothetical protein [Nocardia arthritidis]QIS10503.1 hypothetical protein F5544_13070 [Nocardia arthritidis]
MRIAEQPCTPIGIDIGTVYTKIATDPGTPPWQEPTPWRDAGPDAAIADLLRLLTGRGPGTLELVVAVPDRWTYDGPDEPLRAPEDTAVGNRWRTALLAAGFARVRLVARLHGLAAVLGGPDGCRLLCDIGSGNMSAAVVERSGSAVRLIDVAHRDIGEFEPAAAMLGPGRTPGLLAALHRERLIRSRRAQLVLDRAERIPRYLGTTVYLPGAHGDSIDAESAGAALRPIADLAAGLLRELLAATGDPLDELVLTGGNALGSVVSSAAAAVSDRIHSVRVLPPGTNAEGALRIARGEVVPMTGYPHTIGLVSHRIRYGRLESVILPVPAAGAALEVEVVESQGVSPVIRMRPNNAGAWVDCAPSELRVPPGRYRVRVLTRRSRDGMLSFADAHGDAVLELPIAAQRRPA